MLLRDQAELLGRMKPCALGQGTFKDELFVHTNLGSYFQEDGAEKYYCLAQGLE